MICQKATDLINRGELETALRFLNLAKQEPGLRNCVSQIEELIKRIYDDKSAAIKQSFTVNGVTFNMT